jgi:hypothetical protein
MEAPEDLSVWSPAAGGMGALARFAVLGGRNGRTGKGERFGLPVGFPWVLFGECQSGALTGSDREQTGNHRWSRALTKPGAGVPALCETRR